ncbi:MULTISPECIES: benzoate 1,2-dioxygenase electron transfer component BenC [Tsukamurella]|uniref:1,6-dihydroxycyclohexa-2,4-diene-1-carboxylate dehydrogenase n=3 Tax=Tsukamurella TaxID=2060 RepID=A0A5C5S172_9ACTN|nr:MULTISPECIES: benzoate 1,2-dioxygenase electron transfer component BenC [Tsukamurella]NMD56488.1 1,6-dihydroxycyclohexa-2,4-diene-1-carboxylate dehydrogenase [Tsukamurella columbiensis]TWS29167.1 1,6-dihydroxycyclohexa-2,4-diene-1-carboxylate dehydrogenase [Tsukamurella conjunctivitidis]
MVHQVALAFEDGVTRFISVDPGQTVADASYRQRINIPLDCRDGACGTCKARCESGTYDGGTYVEDALTAEEAEQGYCLPCSMSPTSDLVLQINSTSAVAKTQVGEFAATVTGLERLTPSTVGLRLRADERDRLAFLPGQYVNIVVPGSGADGAPDAERSYSFASHPDDEELEFLVKLIPGGGAMSDWLTGRAAVGDRVRFRGPLGSFFLREADRPALLVAGGTGLAPMLSMLRSMRTRDPGRTVQLLYGVSQDRDVTQLDVLAGLREELPRFAFEHCVSAADSTAAHRGHVTDILRTAHLHGGDVAVYLCGPPPMIDGFRAELDRLGITPTGFYYEKFLPAATSPAPATTAPAAPPAVVTASAPAAAPPAEASAPNPVRNEVTASAPIPAGTLSSDGLLVEAGGALLENPDARGLAGQPLLTARDLQPVTAPPEPLGADGYEIGEEHPDIRKSDAVFEARKALELGALELVLGRIGSPQLAGYRLLAEATVPYLDGDRLTDAAGYTEANAAFHDYLFTLTGNEHLLAAYQRLGVRNHMDTTLRSATWIHPRCAQDHLDIVEAVAAGDREGARTLVADHAERSMETTRRAMHEQELARTPAFVHPGRFAGRVVVVTGAAQGIGERVARRVHAEGGSVLLVDRSDLVRGLADELTRDGMEAVAAVADLESLTGAQDVAAQALERFGRIDVLVNNVGGAMWFKPFTEFTEAQIGAEVTRSLLTTLYSCRAVLPAMQRRGRGVIVNVSSVATRGVHRVPYSAAKGGVNALTASLAMEYADSGIRVVASAPGGTEAPPRRIPRGGDAPETDLERAWFQAHIDQTLESSLMHRYGTLDEQAAVICFLASDEAGYLTGSVLPVGGGDLG